MGNLFGTAARETKTYVEIKNELDELLQRIPKDNHVEQGNVTLAWLNDVDAEFENIVGSAATVLSEWYATQHAPFAVVDDEDDKTEWDFMNLETEIMEERLEFRARFHYNQLNAEFPEPVQGTLRAPGLRL